MHWAYHARFPCFLYIKWLALPGYSLSTLSVELRAIKEKFRRLRTQLLSTAANLCILVMAIMIDATYSASATLPNKVAQAVQREERKREQRSQQLDYHCFSGWHGKLSFFLGRKALRQLQVVGYMFDFSLDKKHSHSKYGKVEYIFAATSTKSSLRPKPTFYSSLILKVLSNQVYRL